MAFALTALALKDENGVGSVNVGTPASGGVLIALIHNTTVGATFTFNGSLAGTWTQLAYDNQSSARTVAIQYCTDYSGAGTVSWSQSAGTWRDFVVALATDSGVINTTSPIQQSKKGAGVSIALDTLATYGVWAASAGGGATTATGMTTLATSSAWDAIGHAKAESGGAVTYTPSGSAANYIVEFKRRASGAKPSFKIGWRR